MIRWLCSFAVLGACGGAHAPVTAGSASLVLDIPNGMLDPRGFAVVEVVLHGPSGDVARSSSVSPDGAFDLGVIDPGASVSIEATLRNDSGAAVGYGRTATAAALARGAEIVIPVRRPIVYIAGAISRDIGNRIPDVRWSQSPATFSDLSVDAAPDGHNQVGGQVVMTVGAGPSLFMVAQATSDPNGTLVGPARLAPISTGDHQVGAPLASVLSGAVNDGAGSDDASAIAIATATALYAVDPATGGVRALANGNFARVAILTTASGEIDAVAIKNRGQSSPSCTTTAELWWAVLSPGSAPAPGPAAAHLIATGGFSDIATDRGRAYYLDACRSELGEVTAQAVRTLRPLGPASVATTSANPARPTALAVSNGQAYIGLETQPAATSLVVAALAGTDPPRTLWAEAAQQVLDVTDLPEVRRQLDATSVVFDKLEVGAGGDYVALTTRAHFHGAALAEVQFPDMTIDAEELRIFDAATGGIVQRYRSWCDGVVLLNSSDISGWECATTAGQAAAADATLEHHINSMTFLFGKR